MIVALRYLGAISLVAACQPAYPLGTPPDCSCIPEWPEECLGPQDAAGSTTGADAGEGFTCAPDPELEEDQRTGYSCIPRPESGDCPEAESACAAEAMENQWIADCRDCLRESVEVVCGPDPEVSDACCYRLVVTSASGDGCD